MAVEWPYRFEIVELDRFFVDESYQDTSRQEGKLVKEIAEDYDPALVGTLIASERNNRSKIDLALIDGQTRWTGARRRDEPALPALIYEGLTRAQEADLFARLQTKRRGITTPIRFRAQVAAKSPKAIAINAAVEKIGWRITNEPGSVRAVVALEKIYNRGPEALERVLRIILAAWPDEPVPEVTHNNILRGLDQFLHGRYAQEDIDEGHLVSRLSTVTPGTLRLRADHIRQGRGSGSAAKYVSEAIMAEYTKRR